MRLASLVAASNLNRATIHLEGYYIESLNKNHAPIATLRSGKAPDLPNSFLSSSTQGWPDRVDLGTTLKGKFVDFPRQERCAHTPLNTQLFNARIGGCKITYVTFPKGPMKHGDLRRKMEGVLYSINSFFVHLALARKEIAMEGGLTLSKAAKFARCSREQVEIAITFAKRKRQLWEKIVTNSPGGQPTAKEEDNLDSRPSRPTKVAFDKKDLHYSPRFAVIVEEVDEDDDYFDIPFFESESLATARTFRRSASMINKNPNWHDFNASRFSFGKKGSKHSSPPPGGTRSPRRSTPDVSLEDFSSYR